MSYNLITILGPTATGKTKLAAKLAKEFDGEIISADSRQVYREMNIGTGKDLKDYIVKNTKIPYHLIDIIEPAEEFDVYKFNNLFHQSFNEIKKKKRIPFLVGGTALYISSILKSYKFTRADFSENSFASFDKYITEELRKILLKLNPNPHNTTDLLDRERIIKAIVVAKVSNENSPEQAPVNSLVMGIKLPRTEIKKRITERLKFRLDNGMINEVEDLLKSGITYEKLNFFGLEYKFIALYLRKELSYNDMFQKLNSAIHNFAKRQMTWFRKMEKEGIKINWLEGPDYERAKNIIKENSYK
jgi:tRNA dimethylallyltransferase